MSTSIAGSVAIVTGAGQGLGRAEALALAAAGASVVVNDLGEAAESVAAEIIAAGGAAVAALGDVGDWNVAGGLVDRAVAEFGELNILVNNAGVTRDRMIFSMGEDDWDRVIRVHLKGHAGTTRAAATYWRQRSKDTGRQVFARLINTTSESFLFGVAGQANYSAAKAGITALTLAVANSCRKYGVCANAIAPRARTPMTESVMPPGPAEGMDQFSVEHIPPVVLWLASPAAAGVNGQVLITYGGRVAIVGAPSVEAVFHTSGDVWSVQELQDTVGAAIAGGTHPGFAVSNALRID